jgi:hypothetical protein
MRKITGRKSESMNMQKKPVDSRDLPWLEWDKHPATGNCRIEGDEELHAAECKELYERRGWLLHGAIMCPCICHRKKTKEAKA